MEYKEYGSKNNDIIILLHGGGLSWWNYIDEISLLENEFHIVIPILDGHSGSDTNFTSIESNALEIINFIKYSSDRDTLRVECKSAVFHADFLLLRLSRFGNSTGSDASS